MKNSGKSGRRKVGSWDISESIKHKSIKLYVCNYINHIYKMLICYINI